MVLAIMKAQKMPAPISFLIICKGTYVFEYPLFVTHTGNFSNGITTIQCMYAPEFSSHSEGVRIRCCRIRMFNVQFSIFNYQLQIDIAH